MKVCDPAMGSGAFLVEACRQLGDALLDAWRAHDAAPAMAAGEDEVVLARRFVAQRCLYGVDRNPMAVDLAKVSLWLATLAKEHPLTFVDHALRHGDSLVGLTQRQIEAFHWEDGAEPLQQGIETIELRKCVARAAELRRRIREADGSVSDWDLRDWWDDARFELGKVRLFGDLVIGAFFEGGKPKERKAKREEYAGAMFAGKFTAYRDSIEQRRREDPPLAPFHWEIEFPEVFERVPEAIAEPRSASIGHSRGFDAIIGNPPFLGGKRISTMLGDGYRDWLAAVHEESSSNTDIVAHFFRRGFHLTRQAGTLGLIATNTIAQGDTRASVASGLRWICAHGGEIYRACRRVPWPGLAAVVVSVVHVHKGPFTGVRRLDDALTDCITAFLFHRGGHDDPARLAENAGKSFQGSIVLGMGFTFDDTDTKGVASPLDEMRQLIVENPRSRAVVFPYIGGEEVNTSPTHAHHRYVINFRDWPLRREELGELWARAADVQRREWQRKGVVPQDYPGPVAADWPELLGLVEARVKPERDTQKRQALRERWWQYADKRPGLYSAIAGLDRVLANSQVGQHAAFATLASDAVYAHTLNIFPLKNRAAFCVLQSRVHETWARFFGSSLEDRLRYTPSDCFETFPFPDAWETCPDLETAGEACHAFRADLMVRHGMGLTKTYNRLHDPHDDAGDIVTLRGLHAALDRAVLDAYDWRDVPTDCEFLLDYPTDDPASGARQKAPYRYRWPDDVRDEVLARLLELNADRAAAEAPLGPLLQ